MTDLTFMHEKRIFFATTPGLTLEPTQPPLKCTPEDISSVLNCQRFNFAPPQASLSW